MNRKRSSNNQATRIPARSSLFVVFTLVFMLSFQTSCAPTDGTHRADTSPSEPPSDNLVTVDLGPFHPDLEGEQITGRLIDGELRPLEPPDRQPGEPTAEPEEQIPDGFRLTAVSFEELPGWANDNLAKALPALRRSCEVLSDSEPDRPVGPHPLAGTARDWQSACRDLLDPPRSEGTVDSERIRSLLEDHFRPYEVSGPRGTQGTFTGYYEQSVDAATSQRGAYQHPIYQPPDDRITVELGRFRSEWRNRKVVGRLQEGTLVPYHDREAIERGALDGRDLELLWADDPVDVFFLHIQGSGVARLPDGRTKRIDYAGTNGREFTGIGSEIQRDGDMDGLPMNMTRVGEWLRSHPERARELMLRNDRYVFFQEIDAEAPIGSHGSELTPLRSLAVDPAYIPLGAPLWLDTSHPVRDEPMRRLMVAQDIGAAIQGPVRGDVFWGVGEEAEHTGGRMKEPGRYWLLLPREAANRSSSVN